MDKQVPDEHKFKQDSGMSFEEVFGFAFSFHLIPIIKNLAGEYEDDDFIGMLKRIGAKRGRELGSNAAQNVPNNDFAAFCSWASDPEGFMGKVLTFDIVENTDKAFEIKVTECLWAKTFCEAGAVEIGHALICDPDYVYCKAFNPRIEMIRSKTLMEGDDCCDHRWVWED